MFTGRLTARGEPGPRRRQPGVSTASTPRKDAESSAADRNKLPRATPSPSLERSTHTHTPHTHSSSHTQYTQSEKDAHTQRTKKNRKPTKKIVQFISYKNRRRAEKRAVVKKRRESIGTHESFGREERSDQKVTHISPQLSPPDRERKQWEYPRQILYSAVTSLKRCCFASIRLELLNEDCLWEMSAAVTSARAFLFCFLFFKTVQPRIPQVNRERWKRRENIDSAP